MEKARMAVKLVNLQLVAVLVAVFVTVMSGGVALGLECMDCHLSSGITTPGAEKCAGGDDQNVHNVFLDKTVDNASSVGLDQLSATTYYVPEFGTIQEAIDAAMDGDEIIVRNGTYREHIDFLGKKITVRSENGPFRTTINGVPNIDKYIVSFWNFEGADSVLDGFTITNGNGGFGGGISCYAAEPTISNCIITGNTAGFGGGIFLCDWGEDAAATIINCLITDNESIEAGGGIYCGGTAPTIINCTISGNSTTGDGGGIRSSVYASPTAFNTILWGNTADGSPDEISVSEGSLIDITYSDIQGGDPDNPGSPYPGIGNIDPCDPAFAGNGDYHLTDSSCCIDTGTDVGAPDYDIDGDIRPYGDGYDMGADEFQPVYAPGKHGKP